MLFFLLPRLIALRFTSFSTLLPLRHLPPLMPCCFTRRHATPYYDERRYAPFDAAADGDFTMLMPEPRCRLFYAACLS